MMISIPILILKKIHQTGSLGFAMVLGVAAAATPNTTEVPKDPLNCAGDFLKNNL